MPYHMCSKQHDDRALAAHTLCVSWQNMHGPWNHVTLQQMCALAGARANPAQLPVGMQVYRSVL